MTLDRHEDNRGEFMQIWQNKLDAITTSQINVSVSNKGTIRGLHFQGFYRQKKFLTVLKGSLVDIMVDIRPTSPTFGKFNYVYLEKGQQLLVPNCLAHGFISLEDETILMYQVDRERNATDEVSMFPIDAYIGHAENENLSLYDFACEVCHDNGIEDWIISKKDMAAKSFWQLKIENMNMFERHL